MPTSPRPTPTLRHLTATAVSLALAGLGLLHVPSAQADDAVPTPHLQPHLQPDVQVAPRTKAPKHRGVTKTLVVQLYWNGFPATDNSAYLSQRILTGPAAWYQTVSHGRYTIAGGVTRPLHVGAMRCGEGITLVRKYERVGFKAARHAGYKPQKYGRIVVALPCPIPKHSGWGSMPGKYVVLYDYHKPPIQVAPAPSGATMTTQASEGPWWTWEDATYRWPDGYTDNESGYIYFLGEQTTPIHEMGHNLGLDHAHLLLCHKHGVTTSFAGHCKSVEYGDDYDVMGSELGPGSFSAPRLAKLHWLAGKVKHVHRKATVRLTPLEGVGGVHALTVKGAGGRVYWVEYRTTQGVDGELDPAQAGVLIHYTKPHTNQTWLVDALPGSSRPANVAAHQLPLRDRDQAQLLPGQSITTPEGITITTVAQDGGSAVVQIKHKHAKRHHK